MKEKWNVRTKEGYLKIHIVAVNVKTKKKILLSMKEVTDDEHVHDDSSKELPELVENIIKSDSMTTTTTTTIDKLFADGGASMKAMRFLGICWEIMELPYCIKVRKRMLKLDGKKETSLGIYQFWPRKKIYKSGKRTAA
jgi:hypothetical protein